MKFYHYTSEEAALSILADKALKFSNLNNLNDPYEELKYFFDEEYLDRTLLSRGVKRIEINRKKKEFQDSYNNIKVVSFSKDFDSQLMWAHYADKHKGIVIQFELINEEQSKYLRVVNYEKEIIKRKTYDTEDYSYALETKGEDWGYENELRLILADDMIINNAMLNFKNDFKVTKLILGYKFNLDSLSFLNNRLQRRGYDNLEIMFLKPSSSHFQLIEDKTIKQNDLG